MLKERPSVLFSALLMRETSSLLFSRLAPGALVLALSTTLYGAQPAPAPAAADRIAVAVVFDTSSSMRQAFRAGSKNGEPKFQVAQRALDAVLTRLDAFTQGPNAKALSVGLYIFQEKEAIVAEPIAPFHPARLRQRVKAMRADAGTPLGDALYLAGRDLLATPAAARHILVLTDGANTNGRTPEAVLAMLQKAAERKQTAIFTHVIALDIEPRVFATLRDQGATLIGAQDEAQLAARFDFILEEKILVEAPR